MAKNTDVHREVESEIYTGLLPALPKERIYKFWDMFFVCSGLGIATWCYVQGGMLGYYLNLKEIFLNTLCMMTFGGGIVTILAIAGCRYGVDTVVYLRSVFGHRGIQLMFLLTFFCTWGYEALNCQVFGSSMTKLLTSANVNVSSTMTVVISIICCWLGWYIALNGAKMVKNVNKVLVPCMLLVGVIILILVFKENSISSLNQMAAVGAEDYGSRFKTYMVNLEWNLAFVISWVNAIGVLPKVCKSEKGALWGYNLGACTIMGFFICIGAVTGLVMAQSTGVISNDPTDWLVALGGPGLGSLSLVMIAFANISTQSVCAYVVSVSTKCLLPKLNYKLIVTIWSLYCTLLIMWGGIWTYYGTFVSIVGVVSAPIVGALIADFLFIRKQKLSVYSLFRVKGHDSYKYTGGFNLVAFAAMAIGALAFILVYNPLTYEVRSGLFYVFTGTGLALLVSMLSYVILAQIPSLKKYVLRDHAGDDVLAYVRPEEIAQDSK